MTKRTLGWTAAIVLVMATTARAQESTSGPALTVCLTFSEGFELAAAASLKSGILAEATRIWQPLGVAVGVPEDFENACDRRILVKSDREAGPEDASRETAIAWVPFTAGRARRVVFVRMSRAVALVDAFKPGIRPPALTEMLLTKLVGRSLAHELGHVLLNSLGHDRSGLMRARYGAHDVLRDLPSAYALNAQQLDRVFGRPQF